MYIIDYNFSADEIMKPLVSVTVVSYNQKDFIINCLESILSQDYPNFEICIADDCSTDGTADIIESYCNKYPGIIKFIRGKKNLGPTKNCNLALMAMSGKYCAMTAGDDIMLPGKLTSQVDFMEKDPECRISYHDTEIVEASSGKVLNFSKGISYAGDGTFDMLLSKGSFIGACTAMFRTKYMPSFGLNECLLVGADWNLHLDILETGGYVKYIDKVLAKHLRHSKNITSSTDHEIELQRFQDVVTTCGLILCKHPDLVNIIKRRLSNVFREMRGIHGGKNYKKYLWASLCYKFNYKSLIGLVLCFMGVRK